MRSADAICAASTKNLIPEIEAGYKTAQESGSKKSPTEREAEIIVPLLVRAAKADLNGIGTLEAPSGDSAQIKALLVAYEAWIAEANSNPLAMVKRNDMYNQARRLAAKYGLAKCAKAPLGS